MITINKDKCISCAICANICPAGIKMVNGKAEIKDENANCLKDAASACPQNAINIGEDENFNEGNENSSFNSNYGQGRGMGQGQGVRRGMGAGKGRGFGVGPRDGRGAGRGRGRKR
jgi:ferredoxin